MKNLYEVVRKPIITEKSNIQKDEANQVTFEVARNANKIEIKNAVQKLFNVKVLDVRTINFKGKKKRVGKNMGKKPDWKKAIVTLNPDEKIEFFDGV
jgi:large subunit ribosomal protein L23